jgi:glutaminyl-tRNA synthetase
MENTSNFIKTIIEADLASGKHDEIITRFPPEPNGFLHIGHARAIITDFESAIQYGGYTNLRYDDTNPSKEDDVYVKAILEDIRWLGYEPKNVYFASDYFEEMYDRAVLLIKKGLAYVDHSTPEEMAKDRGNVTTPGQPSKYRMRSVEENLKLFEEMRAGKFKEGACVLRAKIDMASPNMNLRDPALYRISYAEHHNTGKKWCIYPMYDYAHPLEDAIEGITHSLCSLEFEDHRPLYDWVVRETEMPKVPRQIEFGRLNIENTVMSKRFLRELVESGKVVGWDDPRMPTLSGMRRRGYTP